MPMQKSRVNDIELAYRIDGAAAGAPWLVFSHSLACDHSMWDAQLDAFGDFRLLRFDTRGHGSSSAPAGEYTMEGLAGDALALLNALGIRHCHFVGLSMGGMIGQQLALRAPTRLLSLTLADTSSRYPAAARPMWDERMALVRSRGMDAVLPATLERWFTARFREQHLEEVARIAALIRATPVSGYVGCAHAISHIDFTARLATIACPTLVMVGADDQGTPVSMAEEIVQAIDGSRLEIIPDAAHLSNIEQPQRFNALLRQFLATCS
jgi:3-oxoadipate enol-lactonase